MKRKIQISLVASTALAAVLAQPAIANGRSDGSDVNSLNNPSFDAYTSTNGSGDNLGSHVATRDLNMDGYSIFNLADPTNPLDAISLKYLQDYVSANGDNLGNHTATQVINMNGFGIFQLPAPSGPTHAVNRAYVDTAVAGAGDDLGNHTATQNLNMSNRRIVNVDDPVNGADAVNYNFLQTYVTANGDHLGNHNATRELDMGGFKIENLLDPVDNQDAASKFYVDTIVKSTQDDVDDLKAIRIDSGTGLTGGGDLTQNRTISFDTGWGDGRYALRSRLVNTGTGLTGGGSLASNRTLAFDVAWGDNRFVNNTGNETISGAKTFTGSVVVNTPTAGSQAANKSYVDAAAAAAVGTTYSAGSGLNLSGTTFSVDGTVLRTSGNQSISGVKTFTGELRSFRNSNTPGTNIRFGRDAGQYVTFHGGSSGHFLTGISPNGHNKPLYIRLQSGASAKNFVFRLDGTLGGLSTPIRSTDAANKSYVDARVASFSAGTGLSKSGNTFSFNTSWGDGRYAYRSRQINTGAGLTGGGNLTANRTIRPASMLAALQGLSGSNTGIIVKRSGDVVTTRSIGGGSGIDVSNGNGVNGNPSIALSSNHRRKGATDSSAGVMKYSGYSKANGQFYGGTSNPTRKTRLNYDGHLYATAFYSKAYYYFSDRNLKKDIETVQAADGMEIVRDLNPVTYSWKETGQQAYGVIAQEIEAVMPTAVRTNAAGTKAVDYLQIISPMLAAIQELDERVQTLEDALQ